MSGTALAHGLRRFGYRIVRQSGSHIRLTLEAPPEHHLTIPGHSELKAGTLAAILALVCARLNMSREDVLKALDL
ncbi:MAG: type II toxin-antitoxin system HicA family toxin [Caldimonas sp.]